MQQCNWNQLRAFEDARLVIQLFDVSVYAVLLGKMQQAPPRQTTVGLTLRRPHHAMACVIMLDIVRLTVRQSFIQVHVLAASGTIAQQATTSAPQQGLPLCLPL